MKIYKRPTEGEPIALPIAYKPEKDDLQQLCYQILERFTQKVRMYQDTINETRIVADRIISNAKQQADELIITAQKKIENIKQQAYLEGFKKGQAEIVDHFEKLIQDICLQFKHAKDSYLKQTTSDSLELALLIAERIIRAHIEVDKSILERIICDAISEVKTEKDQIIIRLNPKDYNIIQIDKLRAQYDVYLNFVEDAGIEAGGCIVEATGGVIDGRISTQLAKVREALKNDTNRTL